MIDFLIIGGGIAGLSTAARLSHLGKVLVVEAEKALGYHASGRSAAMFEESYGAPEVIELNQASRTYMAEENGGVLSPRGLMLVASKGEAETFASDCKTMLLDPVELEQAFALIPVLNPGTVELAAYHADAWDIDTDLLMQNFARELRANSGAIVTGAPVSKIIKVGSGWEVMADSEMYSSKMVVNAAGAWADDVANVAGISPVGITPYRRSMARIAAPNGQDVSNWPMLFGVGESWYAKPDAGALIVSPADAEATTPQDAWADDMVLAKGLAAYEAHVTTPVTRMLSNWAGLRSFAPDRLLVLGPDPADPSFVWCAGQGGYGFQSCAAYSQLVSDLVAGKTPALGADLAAKFSPSRF